MRASLIAIALVACAPAIDAPADRQRALDRDDADRMAAQLALLPGVVAARVELRRPISDPLGPPAPAARPALAAVIVTDDAADRAAIETTAAALAGVAAPEAHPAIAIARGPARTELATVGPFTVAARSRGPLRAVLAGGLLVIAALAGWQARRYRRGSRAQ